MDAVLQDLRYAVRQLTRSPGTSLVAIVTLALGIGVNTTVFNVYDAVALRPIPARDPARLVRVGRWLQFHWAGDASFGFSYPEYRFYARQRASLSDLAAASPVWRVREGAAPEAARADAMYGAQGAPTIAAQFVSASFFTVLGLPPALGRGFLSDEDHLPAAAPVVILSDAFWRRRFDADRDVIGKTLVLGGVPCSVIGVAASNFIGAGNPPVVPDVWAPLPLAVTMTGATAENLADDDIWFLQLLGRLAPGVTRSGASAHLDALFAARAREVPADTTRVPRTVGLTLRPVGYFEGTQDIRARAGVAVIMMAVALVLLVACANLASLFFARTTARSREIAIRLSLGAGRDRVLRLLLTESMVLASCGGIAGVFLAMWLSDGLRTVGLRVLSAFPAFAGALALDFTPDWRVLAYAVAASIAAALLFGLAPALRATRLRLADTLKQGDAEPTNARDRHGRPPRLRGALVTLQVTASVTLLVGAALLARGALRASTVSRGFDPGKLLSVSVGEPGAASLATVVRFHQGLLAQLRSIPGVRTAAMGTFPRGGMTPYRLEASSGARALPAKAFYSVVSPGFFAALNVPIVRGRDFTDAEAASNASVVIVSEETARRFWPGRNPIGQRVITACPWCRDRASATASWEVIGVARSVRSNSITRLDPTFLYLPAWTNGAREMDVLLRTAGDPAALVPQVMQVVRGFGVNLAASTSFTTGSALEAGSDQEARLATRVGLALTITLGGLALVLASIGVFGVLAHTVARRTREIGIRMALGADWTGVLVLVLRQGLRPVAVGTALGLLLAAALGVLFFTTFVATVAENVPDLLYGGGPLDPLAFGSVAGLVLFVASLAALLPARSAARVDPVIALRTE
jgi:putative ABC transport system permease protein